MAVSCSTDLMKGLFRRRVLPIVAMLCIVLTTGACNPTDVLHFLAGCKDGSSSAESSSSMVASTAKGDWTGLVGKTEGEIKHMWPSHVAPCSGYNVLYGGSRLQCTWWACMRQRALGHDLGQGSRGDGGSWGASAKARGWKQGAKAGGIISWAPGSGGSDGLYGHVAVVEQVDGDNVHISEGGAGSGIPTAWPLSTPGHPHSRHGRDFLVSGRQRQRRARGPRYQQTILLVIGRHVGEMDMLGILVERFDERSGEREIQRKRVSCQS